MGLKLDATLRAIVHTAAELLDAHRGRSSGYDMGGRIRLQDHEGPASSALPAGESFSGALIEAKADPAGVHPRHRIGWISAAPSPMRTSSGFQCASATGVRQSLLDREADGQPSSDDDEVLVLSAGLRGRVAVMPSLFEDHGRAWIAKTARDIGTQMLAGGPAMCSTHLRGSVDVDGWGGHLGGGAARRQRRLAGRDLVIRVVERSPPAVKQK